MKTLQDAEKAIELALARVDACEQAYHAASTLAEQLAREHDLMKARRALGRARTSYGLRLAWSDPDKAARMSHARREPTERERAQREAARSKGASPEARKKAWDTRRKRRDEQLAQPTSRPSDQEPR